jgi:fluoroacetyl-CoA thioesterase
VTTESGPERLRGQDSLIVEAEDSAVRWGNDGLHVLSTPSILGRMEQVCVATLSPILEPGQMTVGVHVDLHHLAPTSVGETVRYDVELTRRDRGFDVEFTVTDSRGTTVGRGSHRRAVIDRDAFIAKLDEARG